MYRNNTARSAGWKINCTPSFSRCERTRKESSTTLSRSGRPPRRNSNFMQKTRRRRRAVTAEAIGRLAEQGKDVSRFFTNRGRMQGPIQRVNVDLAAGMLEEL